jgi:flagellar basal-body rod protein FlgG
MVLQRKRMDVVTNNIANVDTAGYKPDKLISRSFKDMLLSRVGDPAIVNTYEETGPLNTGVHIDEVVTNFQQGAMMDTGGASDLGLTTDGFFVVSTPDGDRYTRDGSFNITSEGYLVTSDGYYVSGREGNIQIPNVSLGFTVQVNGTVTDSEGAAVARLRVVNFEDLNDLRKEGDNLYYSFSGQTPVEVEDYEVRQGYLEGSNAQMALEMVDMMQLYRSYETSQRVVRMIDESLQKTANEVGRV